MAKKKAKLVDLSHPWSADLWPFIGQPSPTMSDVMRIPAQRDLVRNISTNMHVGTHIDAPIHFDPSGGDMASIPLDRLYHEAAIVDLSDAVKDWDIIYPEHITDRIDVKHGDILIYHLGWHHYYCRERKPNEERYFCFHPGPTQELAKWMLKMKIRWFGVDAGSADHPMNTSAVRRNRPDLVRKFEKKTGQRAEEIFPEDDFYMMHTKLFPHNIIHVENLGGDVDKVLNRRVTVGAFPWKFIGGDGSICRVVAFLGDS
ncbi:MAG: cyclase family protein [Candidatus Bathyarchaeia archaeon]